MTTNDKPVPEEIQEILDNHEYDRREDLWLWFGLSYASFLVLPRVLMHEMPKEWQKKMALLLNEIEDEFPNRPNIGTRVQATDMNGKLIEMPKFLINYRHPDKEKINKMRQYE